MSTDTDFDSGSETHIPDMEIKGDDYDFSSMMEITHANQEADDNADDGNDSDGDISDFENDEEDSESSDLERDASSEEDREDNEDYDEDSEDEYGEPRQEISKDDIIFKDGEKEVPLSKDAQVEIKVNGKKETISLQDALNKASGDINYNRELNKVRDREQQFEIRETAFREETAKVNANAEALLEIKDPYELCEYICDLKGGDPDKMLEDMVKSTVEHLTRYKNMTENELKLDRENRRYKRQERARNAEQKITTSNQEFQAKQKYLDESLETEGFTREDYIKTIDALSEKAKNKEELGFGLDTVENPTEDDIILYMAAKDLDDRVMVGVNELSSDLVQDTAFINKAKQAIVKIETLSGKMSQATINGFIKEALELDNNALSKTLSKKASKAKSERITSRGQELEDEGPGTLEDLNDMFRNL